MMTFEEQMKKALEASMKDAGVPVPQRASSIEAGQTTAAALIAAAQNKIVRNKYNENIAFYGVLLFLSPLHTTCCRIDA